MSGPVPFTCWKCETDGLLNAGESHTCPGDEEPQRITRIEFGDMDAMMAKILKALAARR